jgi:hypothetical protein
LRDLGVIGTIVLKLYIIESVCASVDWIHVAKVRIKAMKPRFTSVSLKDTGGGPPEDKATGT